MFQTKAEVKVKNSKGEVIASQGYTKQVFEASDQDAAGNLLGNGADQIEPLLGSAIGFFQTVVGDKGNGVLELLKHATYSYDLTQRAKIRQSLVANAAGPEKAIEKQVKDFMAARAAMGKPVTEDVARTRVMAMLGAD